MDLMWWALSFGVPFLIGNMGGGGGGATPPKLDVAGSLKLSQGQIDQLIKNAPQVAQVLGATGRSQNTINTQYGLDMLVNPNRVLQNERISPINKRITATNKAIADLRKQQKAGKIDKKAFDSQLKTLQGKLKADQASVANIRQSDPLGDLQRTFAPEFAARDRLLGDIDRARESSPEYLRAQEAMAAGLGRGELGESLYQTALERAQSQGQLTPEASRDAVQAARSGMASRGMATGSAGLAAELLNRDRYSRARMAEDLNFASGVQATDQARQQYNIGLLGAASQMSDAERGRQLGLGQDAYNFRLGTNPRMMLAGLGSPYANMQTPGLQQLGGIVGSVQPQYSGGQFSGQGGGFNMMGAAAGGLGGALSGAAIGTAITPGIGTAIGAGAGFLLGGGAGGLSDKREKTDIKPLGTLSNVLKIPAYEYRYKGEKKKRKGVMAQDVQKVLPEAVAEVDYQGKRRLAIKPAVIGAALAQELTEQTKAVAA